MFKIKRKAEKPKRTVLYNIIEDYSEFDAPGNVTVCAMTEPEDLPTHARVLSESYDVPLETMTSLLTSGGTYVYPQISGLLTRGLFACRIDATGQGPKFTWTLDLMQFAEMEQLARSRSILPVDAAWEVLRKTLPGELLEKLAQKNLGLDYRTVDRTVAKGGDIILIFERIGRPISRDSVSCRMGDWSKPAVCKSLLSCMVSPWSRLVC